MHLGELAAAELPHFGQLHEHGMAAHAAARLLHDPGSGLRRFAHRWLNLYGHLARVLGERRLGVFMRGVQLRTSASTGAALRGVPDGTAARHARSVLPFRADLGAPLSASCPKRWRCL